MAENDFGGSVEASAGGSGIGGGNASGSNGLGSNDGGGGGGGSSTSAEAMGLGQMATTGAPEMTAQDFGALSAIASAGLAGYLGGGGPAVASAAIAAIAQHYGADPVVAAGHLAHDMAMGFNSSVGDNAGTFGGSQ